MGYFIQFFERNLKRCRFSSFISALQYLGKAVSAADIHVDKDGNFLDDSDISEEEKAARILAAEINRKMAEHEARKRLADWNQQTNITKENQEIYVALLAELSEEQKVRKRSFLKWMNIDETGDFVIFRKNLHYRYRNGCQRFFHSTIHRLRM